MNTNDLATVMRAHDGDAPTLMATADRMVAIHRDARRARARIGVGVAAALAAVLAAALPSLVATRHSAPDPASTVLPTATATRDGLPVWSDGTLLTTSVSARAPGTATLRFTVPPAPVRIAVGCPAGAVTMQFVATVNGRPYPPPGRSTADYTACGATFGFDTLPDTHYDVFDGHPATVTVTLTAVRGHGDVDMPLTGRFGIGLRVPVPFNDYSFPPRPATPPAWSATYPALPGGRGGSSTPGRALTYTGYWPAADRDGVLLFVDAAAETPGRIDVSIDGTLVWTIDIWDYSRLPQGLVLTVPYLTAYGVRPATGQPFTISFHTRQMGGRWQVEFEPAVSGTGGGSSR